VDRNGISGAGERQHDRAADASGAAGNECGRRGCSREGERHVRLMAQIIAIGNPALRDV
jgi:hypothetical protein